MAKKYKAGQLITFKNHVYRITECKTGCRECEYSILSCRNYSICTYCVDNIYINLFKHICYKLVLVK